MKQCKFYEYDNDTEHYGIIDDDDNVICIECGGLFEHDEIYAESSVSELYSMNNKEYCMIKILEIYDEWKKLVQIE